MTTKRLLFRVFALLAAASVPSQTTAQTDQRTTGLPPRVSWTFNFDAGWGTFGFGNSLFDNPKEGVEEDLSDQWFEGYVKPALSGAYTMDSSSVLYGKVSVVGERTYGSVPALYGSDVSSFGPEDAFVGWRSGKSVGSSENVLDFSFGREQYRLGHGFLLWDGAAEGGSRGGYWTNGRKAFELAAIGRVKPGPHLGEVFYLDKDELEESESATRLWGANYEISIGANSTVGVTYLKFMADPNVRPERDQLNVFNVRTFAAPINSVPDLSFEFEYASERNGELLESNAWTLLGAYQLSSVGWMPKFSYRYALFQGDDPETPANEAFDPLLLGFYDWGSWWQGEIAGEYFLSNSNLVSHQIRGHVAPTESIGTGVIFWKFLLDQPLAVGPGVTDDDVAFEIDAYMDWRLNSNIQLSVLGAFADPGTAVQQATGRDQNFRYGMVYLAYNF